jgi:hypothetical protein
MLLIAIPNVAFAEGSNYHSMSLGLAGGFAHVANQQYQQSGGAATYARLRHISVSLSSVSLTYGLNAAVAGSTVSGTAYFSLTGTGSSGDDDRPVVSGPVSVVAQAVLVGMVPAVGFPLDPTQPANLIACYPNCQSNIPAFFIGAGDIQVTFNGVTTDNPNAVFLFESAYLNPFGGPIVMGTADGSVRIAATYTAQNSIWSGVQTAGVAIDSNGIVIGNFALTSNLSENLVTGTENDSGTMTLYGFSGQYSSLNSVGTFSGVSIVPTTGSFDCTAALGAQLYAAGIYFRLPEKACLATGSLSSGGFQLRHNSYLSIKGAYGLYWSVPALGFGGTVICTWIGGD